MSIPIRIELHILESVDGRILNTRFNLLYQTSRTPLHNYKIAFTKRTPELDTYNIKTIWRNLLPHRTCAARLLETSEYMALLLIVNHQLNL